MSGLLFLVIAVLVVLWWELVARWPIGRDGEWLAFAAGTVLLSVAWTLAGLS